MLASASGPMAQIWKQFLNRSAATRTAAPSSSGPIQRAALGPRESHPGDPANERDAERMRAGRAPFTVGGVFSALQNAFNTVRSPLMMGVSSVRNLNKKPDEQQGFFGDVVDKIFGSGMQSIAGRTPYDTDLREAVRKGKNKGGMSLADADRIQRERNTRRAAMSLGRRSAPSGRSGLGGRDRSAGRGGMGGSLGGNTPSGRDKPGPGGKVR